MSSMQWAFSDVYKKVSNFLGTGTSPSGTALTDAKDLVYRGYMHFLFPIARGSEIYTWSFLKQRFVLNTEASKYVYPLPEDFERFVPSGKLNFGSDENNSMLTYAPLGMIEYHRNLSDASGTPVLFSIQTTAFDKKVGSKKELVLWPAPSEADQIIGWYVITPAKPESDTDFFIGGPLESEVILQCCLAAAEFEQDEVFGVQNQKAAEMLAALIRKDSGEASDSVGYVHDGNIHYGEEYFNRWSSKNWTHSVYE